MRAGDWVGGKWRLGLELPRGNDWMRIAIDSPEDPPTELILPMGHALLRPNVREAFVGWTQPEHPAILPILDSGVADTVPWRIRARTSGPLPSRLPPAETLAVAISLAPAILAGDGFLKGNLDRGDVSFAGDGRVVLVPSGIPPKQPVSELPGVAGDAGALGRLLFQLVEGRVPAEGETGPSAAGTDILTPWIRDLLQPDPDLRLQALQKLAALPPAPVKAPTAIAAPPSGNVSIPLSLPPYFLVVRRNSLTTAALQHVARESGVTLETLKAGNIPRTWPVEGCSSEAEAIRRSRRLTERGIPNEVISLDERAGWPWLAAALLLALEAILTVPVAAGMVVRSLIGGSSDLMAWLPIVVASACALMAVISGRKGMFLAFQNDRRDEAKRAWANRHLLQDRNDIDPLFAQLARIRDELPMLGLPDVVVEDLRQMLAETGEALEDATQPGAATHLRDEVAKIIQEIHEGLQDKDLEGIARLEQRFRSDRGQKKIVTVPRSLV